jgi:hypothetical protein
VISVLPACLLPFLWQKQNFAIKEIFIPFLLFTAVQIHYFVDLGEWQNYCNILYMALLENEMF